MKKVFVFTVVFFVLLPILLAAPPSVKNDPEFAKKKKSLEASLKSLKLKMVFVEDTENRLSNGRFSNQKDLEGKRAVYTTQEEYWREKGYSNTAHIFRLKINGLKDMEKRMEIQILMKEMEIKRIKEDLLNKIHLTERLIEACDGL